MIAVILGTRPELIKCAPVILEAQRRGIPIGIVHTGQHYTPELDDIFFKELDLPQPIAHVHVGSHPAPRQIGLMMERLTDVLLELKPSCVLVQGDTNSVLAGALTAYKLGIPVAHLEAGLRSGDWTMPEEANRVLTDRISDWLFCPTEQQQRHALDEGIMPSHIHVVGNTIVDASLHYSRVASEKSDIVKRLNLTDRPYALLTMHRPSNVDDPQHLNAMLHAIEDTARRTALLIVFPVHPRTKAVMDRNGISLGEPFLTTPPLGYLDLLRLQCSAQIILTDSGGIQEEACILRIPSITLRPNTERPETLDVGASVLCHEPDTDMLLAAMRAQCEKLRTWNNPFGDGHTAERVLDALTKGQSSL